MYEYTVIASFTVECLELMAFWSWLSLNVASWISKVEFYASFMNISEGLQSPEYEIFTEDLCSITKPKDWRQWITGIGWNKFN